MSAALATYRRLITLAKRLPEPDAKNAITQIREAFRANKSVDSEERLTELFNLAYSKLGYLKIVTPKFAGDDARGSGGRFVVVNGAVVDGAAEVQSRATHKGEGFVDVDSLKRHRANLNRFQFGDRESAPSGPVWE